MMLKGNIRIAHCPVVGDSNKDQVSFVLLKPVRIFLTMNLSDRCISVFIILQFDQQGRNVRLLWDKRKISVSLPGIHNPASL